eukprot:352560-Chlamydomonas_euryale.AAC.2
MHAPSFGLLFTMLGEYRAAHVYADFRAISDSFACRQLGSQKQELHVWVCCHFHLFGGHQSAPSLTCHGGQQTRRHGQSPDAY